MTTLYQLDNKGKIRSWTMEVQGGKFRTITGIKGGAMITNEWTICEGKNIGKTNETTPEQQAISEAMSQIQKKRDKGYKDTTDDAMLPSQFECMTAKKYDGWDGETVYSQPKFDGIRCNASVTGMMSRGFKPIPTVPHIEEALQDFFKQYPTITLDGELYNHELRDDFNEIASLVKRKNLTPEDLERSKNMVQYHVYDYFDSKYPDEKYGDRINALLDHMKVPFVIIAPTTLCKSEEELDKCYQEYVGEGFEGQMIRIPNSVYEQKRSKNLLKRKPLYDDGCIEEEFEIVGVHDANGKWANKLKVVDCLLPNGKICSATVKGNMQRAAKLWLIKDQLIGKMATVKFQNYTPDGLPRFPVAWDLDRGGY